MTSRMGLGALFTVPMPYPPPFSVEEHQTIEEALRTGLARGIARNPSLGQSPLDEVKITAGLEEELTSMMEAVHPPVPGFTSDLFETLTGADTGLHQCQRVNSADSPLNG